MRRARAIAVIAAIVTLACPARAEDKPHWVSHGEAITAAKVGPAAAGFTALKPRPGGELKDRTAAASWGVWVEKAATYDGFDVPAGHLLIQGVAFSSPLDISAPFPVVLRGVSVRIASGSPWGILMRPGAGALYVLWSDAGASPGTSGAQQSVDVALDVRGSPSFVYHSHFSRAVDGMHVSGSNARIEQNLIDDLIAVPQSHNDGIQLLGMPSNVNIAKNKVINRNPQTSCLNLLGRNITVTSNWLSGGGWTVYGGANNNGHGGEAGGPVTVYDNIFGRDLFAKGGHFGPIAYWDKARAAPDDWLANRYDDGMPVKP